MTKHYCDKCKAEMPSGMVKNVKIGLWVHNKPDIDPYTGERPEEYDSYKVFSYDVCNDCSGELTEFISGTNEVTDVIRL